MPDPARKLSDDPLLTEAEAGRELRVSVTTIRRERQEGRLSYCRIRGRVFIPLSELTAYRHRCLITASADAPAPRAGTSSGLTRAADRDAIRRARQIAQRLS